MPASSSIPMSSPKSRSSGSSMATTTRAMPASLMLHNMVVFAPYGYRFERNVCIALRRYPARARASFRRAVLPAGSSPGRSPCRSNDHAAHRFSEPPSEPLLRKREGGFHKTPVVGVSFGEFIGDELEILGLTEIPVDRWPVRDLIASAASASITSSPIRPTLICSRRCFFGAQFRSPRAP